MQTYTKEKDCVSHAKHVFLCLGKTQLIFKKGRKYICVTGELRQQGKPFKNAFGETLYYSERSNIRKEYESKGYELRGWVNVYGCFKNN